MTAPRDGRPIQQTIRELLSRHLNEMAREVAEDYLEASSNSAEALRLMAEVMEAFHDYNEAGRLLDEALTIAPNDPNLHAQAATSCFRSGDYPKALASLKYLREACPHVPEVILEQSRVLLRQSGPEEAEAILEELPATARNHPLKPLVLGLIRLSQKRDSEAEALLIEAGRCERLTVEQRCHGWFEVAKVRDRGGDYDGAWEASTQGHALANRPFDCPGYDALLASIRKVFDRQHMRQWARASKDDDRQVFIVGMPRSGTTLLEQILSMHPGVANAGEMAVSAKMQRRLATLTDSFLPWPKSIADMQERDADALQRMYQDAVADIGPGKLRVTNKSLVLQHHLGLLNLTNPGSHSIMLHRHPLDNMVSCYTTDLISSGHSYCSDVRTLARVWVARREMQDFWSEHLETPPLQLHYERLVADQETETRALLAHLRLPWEEACLSFHKSTRKVTTISHDQVTRKMYGTSKGRWRNYEKFLAPAMDIVAKYI